MSTKIHPELKRVRDTLLFANSIARELLEWKLVPENYYSIISSAVMISCLHTRNPKKATNDFIKVLTNESYLDMINKLSWNDETNTEHYKKLKAKSREILLCSRFFIEPSPYHIESFKFFHIKEATDYIKSFEKKYIEELLLTLGYKITSENYFDQIKKTSQD